MQISDSEAWSRIPRYKEDPHSAPYPYPSPISYKGEYHFRSGSTKQELKGAALQRFLMRKQGRHWDDAPVPGFNAEDCSREALQLFKARARESGRVGEEALQDKNDVLLENLQLRDGQY